MNFDFRLIEVECPKALALLKEWIVKSIPTNEDYPEYRHEAILSPFSGKLYYTYPCPDDGFYSHNQEFNPLELDFFFDEQGITGSIEVEEYKDGRLFWEISWHTKEDKFCGDIGQYKTRSEALTALWLKEFSILESSLEGSEGK